MDRRTFLQKSLKYGVGLWLTGYLLDSQLVWAAERPVEASNIRNLSSSRKLLPQIDYFRIVINLSAQCEFETTHDDSEYRVTLLNCNLTGGGRKITVKSNFVSKYAVRKRRDNVQIDVSLQDDNVECRTYILPPDTGNKSYRLIIDIGLLGAMPLEGRSGNIPARENDFIFGELTPRIATSRIIIHHVGGNRDMDVSAATIHRWHLQNGWSGIGYHFVIRKDGTLERGRPQDVMGAHTYHYNADSLGICVTGNFEIARPTLEQMATLNLLVTAACTQYGITPDRKHILGHRELNSTECPGRNLYRQLDAVRSYARAHFLDK